MSKVLGFIYGTAWGVSHIVPGLSGGTLLVVFGCYDTVCKLFALDFKEIKKNLVFFIFFITGAAAGILGFVYVFTYLFEHYNVQTCMFFIGLVIGGVPLILRLAKEGSPLKAMHILPFLLGLAIVMSFFFIEYFGISAGSASDEMNLLLFAVLVLGCFIAAVAMVVPGISGASILIAVGLYDTVMNAVKEMDIITLAPVAAGMILGIVIGARVIIFLLKKSKTFIYCVISGMVIGSLAPLFPQGLGVNIPTLTGAVCLVAGCMLSVLPGRKEKTEVSDI